MTNFKDEPGWEELNKKLSSLDERLQKLEAAIHLPDFQSQEEERKQAESTEYWDKKLTFNKAKLESGIGEYGLAWLGNIVLLFAISFFTQYLQGNNQLFLAAITGYGSIISIFILARYTKKIYTYLASMFQYNGYILLYLISLRLHFFTSVQIIPNRLIVLLMLLCVIGFIILKAIQNRSQVYLLIGQVFLIFTGLVSDSSHLTLSIFLLTSIIALVFYVRFGWKKTLNVSLILTYLACFFWFFNNPIMGHSIQSRPALDYGHFYLFAIVLTYSFVTILRIKMADSERFATGIVVVNGLFFSLLLAHLVMTYFVSDYIKIFILITIMGLGFSILIKRTSEWRFPSAFFALYGFMAMSITIYGFYHLPDSYFLYSIQSLIVVSMALWFRNKIIVLMNALLFITLMTAYLISGSHTDMINFSFAIIALLTARIINWKKDRLGIKTDNLRIFYLFMAFFMVLYALHQGFPQQYITLSWTVTAFLYFLFSIILRNKRYRYMALGTLIAAAIYLLTVDLAKFDVIYRVLAFLLLAAISIGVSVYYTRHFKKSGD